MPAIFMGLTAAVSQRPGTTSTIKSPKQIGSPSQPPALSPALSKDCFVRFGGKADDLEAGALASKRKADSAYAYYQMLPQTEEAFEQKLRQLLHAEKKRLGKSLSEEQKTQIKEQYASHIINQWINVEELYVEAVYGHGNPESIRPKDLSAPDVPGIGSELVQQIRYDRIHRSNRSVDLERGNRHSSPETPSEAYSPGFGIFEE